MLNFNSTPCGISPNHSYLNTSNVKLQFACFTAWTKTVRNLNTSNVKLQYTKKMLGKTNKKFKYIKC